MFEIGQLTRLPLGYVGENGTRTISIDMKAWLDEYPGALIMIQVIRPVDHYKYPAAYTKTDGVIHWTIDGSEVMYAGKGLAQIALYNPDTKQEYKSRVVGTIVAESLDGFNDILLEETDPASKWVNQVLEAAESAEASKNDAANSKEEAAAAIAIVATQKNEALIAIQNEGAAQVVSVNDAGTQQAQLVEAKGEEVLGKIPEDYTELSNNVAALSEDIARNTAPPIVPTATGSIVTITDGAARPAVEVISHIEPVQSGSGEASPNNKRPISGWNSLNAWRTGANLAYNEAISSSIGGLTFTVSDDGTITVDGTANEIVFYHVGAVTLKPGSYRMSGAPFGGSAGTYYMYFDTYYGDRVIDNGAGVTFGVSAEMTISLTIRINQGATVSELIFRPGITREDYEGSYAPYQGQTLSDDLPETVYGGKRNWTTGVLTVTHKIVDLSTLVWHYDSAVGGFFTTYLSGEIGSNNKGFLVCSAYTAGDEENWWTTNYSVSFDWDGRVLIRDTRFSDAADFVAALSGVMLVYPLATPYTIQLTPHQLSTLYGINNVWSDCGDTTISYMADTQRYIDNKLAAIAAATL